MRKEDQIRVLVTEAEKDELAQAANRAGLAVATWLRSVGLQAARQVQPDETAGHRRASTRRHP